MERLAEQVEEAPTWIFLHSTASRRPAISRIKKRPGGCSGNPVVCETFDI